VWKQYSADVQKAEGLVGLLEKIKCISRFCNWAVDTHKMYTKEQKPPFSEPLMSRLRESMQSGMHKLREWESDTDMCDTREAERIMNVAKSWPEDATGAEKTVRILVWNHFESRRAGILSCSEKDTNGKLKNLGALATECNKDRYPKCGDQVNASISVLRSGGEWAFEPDWCSVTHRVHVKPQEVGAKVVIQAHPLTNGPLVVDIPDVELSEDDDNTTSFPVAGAGFYTREEGSWEIVRASFKST
jgi:hypothetical protein